MNFIEDDGFTEDRSDVDNSNNTTFIYNPNVNQTLNQQRKRLPVFQMRNHILYLLEEHQVVVIVGETGSGKSTQVPQVVLIFNFGIFY